MEAPNSLLAEKIGSKLGVPLDQWVSAKRDAKMSFDKMAAEINGIITPHSVSGRTLAYWFPEAKRIRKPAGSSLPSDSHQSTNHAAGGSQAAA